MISKILTLSPAKQFLIFCLAFIAGIGLAGALPDQLVGMSLWWFSAAVLCLAAAIIFWSDFRLRLILLGAVFLFAGLWRHSLVLQVSGPELISFYNNRRLELEGTIVSEPDERVDQVRYEVGGLAAGGRKLAGKLLLVGNLAPVFAFGDKVSISCRLKAPKDRDDFSYSRYLARYDIYSICYYPETRLSEPAVWRTAAEKFYGRVYQFKSYLRLLINRGLPEPAAALANGMILGDQKSLPAELRAEFSRTGLSHIIAISGMNITIIAVFFSWLILALGASRRSIFYLAGLLIALYIILIGAPASAVRAGLISGLMLLAAHLGRLGKITNALCFAAAVMLLFSPKLLRDDLGFVLSFLAIFSLVFFYESLDQRLAAITGERLKFLRQAVSLTLAAQILTWPVMAYNFSQLSLVAPLANLAALWTLPILTAAIFLVLPLAGLAPIATGHLFIPARLILEYLLAVAHYLGGWQFAAVNLDFKYPLLILVYYGLIAWYLVRRAAIAKMAGDR
jgi:competence protein ComEC